MDVIDRLNAVVEASGKAQKTIAHDAGLSASTLSRLLGRQMRPRVDDVEAVLRALGLTMQALYAEETKVDVRVALRTLTEYVEAYERPARSSKPKRAAQRLVRPFPVAATPNVVLFDESKRGRRRIPDELWAKGARHAAQVIGDSMTGAGIEDGDVVFFRRPASQRPPRGALVIIRVNDGVYLKRYEEAGGEKRLISDNEAYRPIVLQPDDEIELYGIAVR